MLNTNGGLDGRFSQFGQAQQTAGGFPLGPGNLQALQNLQGGFGLQNPLLQNPGRPGGLGSLPGAVGAQASVLGQQQRLAGANLGPSLQQLGLGPAGGRIGVPAQQFVGMSALGGGRGAPGAMGVVPGQPQGLSVAQQAQLAGRGMGGLAGGFAQGGGFAGGASLAALQQQQQRQQQQQAAAGGGAA